MFLPGRLRDTTLGDLLGALSRAEATGVLELLEGSAVGAAIHRVYLARGSVVACESPRGLRLSELLLREGVASADLFAAQQQAAATGRLVGEVLVAKYDVSSTIIDKALRQQILTRLTLLEGLTDAALRFRVATRPPRSASRPLGGAEVLPGRRRKRDRGRASPLAAEGIDRDARTRAAATLGVAPNADASTLRRAFRERVAAHHPDRAHGATDEPQRNEDLRAILDAYALLKTA